MPPRSLDRAVAAGRWLLLAVLGGHLLFRREFAHRNLGELFQAIGMTPPVVLGWAYVTEVALLILAPIVILEARRQWRTDGEARSLGAPFYCIAAFCGWGAIHLAWAFATRGEMAAHPITGEAQPRSTYLIFRQTALAVYPAFFLMAVILFRRDRRAIERAAVFGIAVAVICAVMDTFGLLGPKWHAESKELLPIYGQETLPLGILGLAFVFASTVTAPHTRMRWGLRVAALLGLAFVGWRQAARPMQSVVPVGMTVALALMTVATAALIWKRRVGAPLGRMGLCLVLFVAAGGAYLAMKSARASATEKLGASEVKAWSIGIYPKLFDAYNNAVIPTDESKFMIARRPPYVPVRDPEVYRLQTVVVETQESNSVRNNMWRFLVWRRMAADWREGSPVLGRGVGRPWFYAALYQTSFHYGDDREGLDPHNSFLNVLFRYGVVGFGLFAAGVIGVIIAAWRALRDRGGDAWLEGLLLYFFYTLAFAFFVVSLEGPSYSMPFWVALGLVHARASGMAD